MARWLNPLIFCGGAAYVAWYNGTHEGSKLVFPFSERLTGGDIESAGTLTWTVFGGVGVLFAIWALYAAIRDRRTGPSPEDGPG